MKKLLTSLAATIGLAAGAFASTYNLANQTIDRTFANGDVVYGTLGSNIKLSIAAGATVTISNAVINGVDGDNYHWAGITCNGSARIALKGSNTIRGFHNVFPGIHVMWGNTLIIEGDGSLVASSNGHAPGIGGGNWYMGRCGNIIIYDGNITATGGSNSAGIGGQDEYECGKILIMGGNINATGGDGAAGIGAGYGGLCAGVQIYSSTGVPPTVTAKGGDGAPGIGTGSGETKPSGCGFVEIINGTVTATGGNKAAGIGCGYKETYCGIVKIGSEITKVTATQGQGAGDNNQIGNTYISSSECIAVVVDESLSDVGSGDTRVITPRIVKLADITEDTTVDNGKILTGKLGGNYKISIAAGATVTLRDVTINGVGNSSCKWAGITCEGSATIILESVNTVKGFYENYPGIYVPENKTLTIKGSGALTASSNGYGAGIGAGYAQTGACGNIVIEGGSIVASGGNMGAAGIGSCYGSSCGNISITGGTVLSTGGATAAGIGCGAEGRCGNITIAKTVERVTAVGGAANYGYGAGKSIGLDGSTSGSCGTVTIGGVVTGSIDESPYTYPENLVNLSSLTEPYTANDGDVLRGETEYQVTIPGGATVTVNGVGITGAGGGSAGTPEFSADGKAATTEFVKGAGGTWTLTTFAELSNDALGKDVTDGQIKVYAADTLEELKTASPMSSGVTVTEKKSAVKTTIEVTPPGNPDSQFFKVKFGE